MIVLRAGHVKKGLYFNAPPKSKYHGSIQDYLSYQSLEFSVFDAQCWRNDKNDLHVDVFQCVKMVTSPMFSKSMLWNDKNDLHVFQCLKMITSPMFIFQCVKMVTIKPHIYISVCENGNKPHVCPRACYGETCSASESAQCYVNLCADSCEIEFLGNNNKKVKCEGMIQN